MRKALMLGRGERSGEEFRDIDDKSANSSVTYHHNLPKRLFSLNADTFGQRSDAKAAGSAALEKLLRLEVTAFWESELLWLEKPNLEAAGMAAKAPDAHRGGDARNIATMASETGLGDAGKTSITEVRDAHDHTGESANPGSDVGD